MLQLDSHASCHAAEIVESDQLYFELGARTEQLGGARIAWMEGLTHLPAGAVVHRVSPDAPLNGPSLRSWESRLLELGAPLGRLYLDDAGPGAAAMLARSGYERRVETTYCGPVVGETSASFRILPVTSPDLWRRKLELHRFSTESPDGHPADPADWVDLERRKCATGRMAAFIALHEDEVVGTFAIMPGERLYRLKNLVIHAAWQRRGLGMAVLRWASALAGANGRSGICMLAVAGSAGDKLYGRAGLTLVGQRTEWTKALC